MVSSRILIAALTIAAACLPGTPGLAAEPIETVEIASAPGLGRADAPLTLVAFSGYDCFYCRRHEIQVHPRIVKAYIETGKLRFMVREFPPGKPDSPGFRATEAAYCAADQGRYWDMRTALFANQDNLAADKLVGYAQGLGLATGRFERCLADGTHRDRVLGDYRRAKAAGINGVPMFFLGVADPDDPGRLRVMTAISGSKVFEHYKAEIDFALGMVKQFRTSESRPAAK
jgi:protein-disulfide isomerase